jgi:glucose-6-phosphate 1-epimerase
MNINDLNGKFGVPGAISFAEGNSGLPKAILKTQIGSQTEVYLHGAHVASWKNPTGQELFFLSKESNFAPGKPIRGGIPICFPQFGSNGPLPQHGLARISEWGVKRAAALDDGDVSLTLELSDSSESLAQWPHRFHTELSVRLGASLTLTMDVVNPGDAPFRFNVAFHTYFAVTDVTRATVAGLVNVMLLDSLRDGLCERETRTTISFNAETDRVYVRAPDLLRLNDDAAGRTFRIAKRGMADAVVWNPWIDKARRMPDFGDDEYRTMVCVETGNIASPVELAPGQSWQGSTRFSAIP